MPALLQTQRRNLVNSSYKRMLARKSSKDFKAF